MSINIKETAETIADILEQCSFDDITDSSGYFAIKEFEDGSERYVDVHKSTNDGEDEPHYAIYVSFEDETSDWRYTKSLSVDELTAELEEISVSEAER